LEGTDLKKKELTTMEEIKVFSDPYRMRILNSFQRLGEATVKEIADELGETPAKVHYHVKKMEKVGFLQLVRTKEINGIIAKYYEPTAELFAIRRESLEKPINSVFESETHKLIEELFDSGKKTFLEMGVKQERGKGILTLTDVYLSAVEAEEFVELVKDFMEKHREPGQKQNKQRHSLFLSLVGVKDVQSAGDPPE
jgi:DNA-binding MarR family transcriptional regulator